jgi:ferredoxin-NADP reductase
MKLTLIDKKQETPDVVTFVFNPEEPVEYQPGQFFHYVLHHRPTDDRGSDRWFTISAAPYEKHISITTRQAQEKSSTFKKELFALEVGKDIEVSLLEGDFTLEDSEEEYIFIAGGIGVTPFRSILAQLDYEKKPINVTLLYSNRDENVVFKKEFEDIASRNPNFKIHYIFSPAHIDEETVKKYVPDVTKPIFYISGPEPMVDSLGEMLKNMGIPDQHIKQDWFPGYEAE